VTEDRAIPVRVVRVHEKRGWGFAATLGGLFLTLLHPNVGSSEADAWVLQGALALWCLGTILTFIPRSRPVMFRSVAGEIRLGDEVLPSPIVDASVARGEHGYSILIAKGGEPMFLEVESESDARRVLAALDVPWPGVASIAVVTRDPTLRRLHRIIAGVGIFALAFGALVSLVHRQTGNDLSHILGPLAVVATLISTVFLAVDPKLRRRFVLGDNSRARKGVADGKSTIDQHIRAHLHHRIAPSAKDDAPPSSVAGHTRTLDRTEETTRAWLARIDALGSDVGGYRGAAPTAEELWQIAEDRAAPERARLAAIRLLGRRHGAKDEVRTRIADDELAKRVRVVVEEDDASRAAEELDALGPIFRAKERA